MEKSLLIDNTLQIHNLQTSSNNPFIKPNLITENKLITEYSKIPNKIQEKIVTEKTIISSDTILQNEKKKKNKFNIKDFRELEAEEEEESENEHKKKAKNERKNSYSDSETSNNKEYLNDSFIDNEPEENILNKKTNLISHQEILYLQNQNLFVKKEEEEIKNFLKLLEKKMPIKRKFTEISNISNTDKLPNKGLIKNKQENIPRKTYDDREKHHINKITEENFIKNPLDKNKILENFELIQENSTNFQKNCNKLNNLPKQKFISISKMKKTLISQDKGNGSISYEKNSNKILSFKQSDYSYLSDSNNKILNSKNKLNLRKINKGKDSNFIEEEQNNVIDQDLEDIIDKYELNIKKKIHENSQYYKDKLKNRIKENNNNLKNINDLNSFKINPIVNKNQNIFSNKIINEKNFGKKENQQNKIESFYTNKILINKQNSFLAAYKSGKIEKDPDNPVINNTEKNDSNKNKANLIMKNLFNKNNNLSNSNIDNNVNNTEKKNQISRIFN